MRNCARPAREGFTPKAGVRICARSCLPRCLSQPRHLGYSDHLLIGSGGTGRVVVEMRSSTTISRGQHAEWQNGYCISITYFRQHLFSSDTSHSPTVPTVPTVSPSPLSRGDLLTTKHIIQPLPFPLEVNVMPPRTQNHPECLLKYVPKSGRQAACTCSTIRLLYAAK